MAPAAGSSTLSSSDRIKQLNEIDQDVVKLLESAGSAIKALTTSQGISDGETSQSMSIEEQKASFAVASSQYLTILSSIDVRLRRQINALEDAEVIPGEATAKELQTSQATPSAFVAMGSPAALTKPAGGNRPAITGGGLGSLDVGWLNSRNDQIGKGMEAELWDEAQRFVERLQQEKGKSGSKSGGINGHLSEDSHPDPGTQEDGSRMDET